MTAFPHGFVIGKEAFADEDELKKKRRKKEDKQVYKVRLSVVH